MATEKLHQSERLVSAQEMREIDAFTINEMGVPSAVLMERAALACVTRLERGDFDLLHAVCLCGVGNNGGDGMAIARLLHLAGRKATIVLVGDEDHLSMDAMQQLVIAENYRVPVVRYQQGCLEQLGATTFVDALFGVGLSRPLAGDALACVKEAKALVTESSQENDCSPVSILAVDIPSGISADTGEVLGAALAAQATVTFAYNKIGLTSGSGPSLAGELTVADIGVYDR
ncbi:MAG: NAD(P)H-hydrate epimerase [Coriobacteriales bacterium]|jgi:NAD(P)H-hydrate epimerase|nr:NAD(P)H-hydrate epimerase [Coriobacteriales bacterium]